MYTYKKAPMRDGHGQLDPVHLPPTPFNVVRSHVVKKDRDGGLEVFKNTSQLLVDPSRPGPEETFQLVPPLLVTHLGKCLPRATNCSPPKDVAPDLESVKGAEYAQLFGSGAHLGSAGLEDAVESGYC
jgi:hypothetical protein